MFLWRSRCVTSWRGAAVVIFLISLATSLLYYYIYITSRLPFKLPKVKSEDCIPSRRELARRVMMAQQKVEEALTGKRGGTLAPSLVQELRDIARELDPRVALGEAEATLRPQRRAVCGEVYRGKSADESLLQNFVQIKCDDAPPFREVVTVILSTKGWSATRVRKVVTSMKEHYDLNIVVLRYGPGADLGTLGAAGDVSVRLLSTDTSASSAFNKVAAEVQTPFVLLSDSLTHFSSKLCSLERLVRVMDQENEVGVAAGSYRTLDGTWRHGCLQRRMENYQLAYLSGYEHSRHDCMFCDDVVGPFMVRTSLLRKVPLQDDLEAQAALRDWFINLRLSGSLVVVCPDVMFFVDEAPLMTRQEWLRVASTWAVQHVWPHDGEKLEFSCPELGMQCVNLMKVVSSFLIPPCCREEQRRELTLIQECAEELGLYVELQAGSLLGAVKTDGILPWDFDTDVLGDCKELKTWMKEGRECVARKGCKSVHVSGAYWIAKCNITAIDVSCKPNRLEALPKDCRSIPTHIIFDGKPIVVPPNPALVARNHYGPDFLRHEVHWRFIAQGKQHWNRCQAPGFHSCLENFPTDGNIRFKDFAHQLPGF